MNKIASGIVIVFPLYGPDCPVRREAWPNVSYFRLIGLTVFEFKRPHQKGEVGLLFYACVYCTSYVFD